MIAAPAEIWTGAVNCLPTDRDDLAEELFAPVDVRADPSGVAVVGIHGLVDRDGWQRIAVAVFSCIEAGADSILLRISSRAQEARGAGLAFHAVEQASRRIGTVAHIESAGAFGAAMALATCAETIVADEAETLVGGMSAAAMYGDDDDQLAADVELILRTLASRRSMNCSDSYPSTVAYLVNAGRLTLDRAQAALDLLNDRGTD